MDGPVAPREVAKKARLKADAKAQRAASARARAWDAHWSGLKDYIPQFRQNMSREQFESPPIADYMTPERQPALNPGMRAILVDWLVHLHKNLRLRSKTLFMAVRVMDRFLEKQTVPRKKLQLVGVVALFIAMKFNDSESSFQSIDTFVFSTRSFCTRTQIQNLEAKILNTLQFRIWRTNEYDFHEMLRLRLQSSQLHFDVAHFLLELALVEYKMAKYLPSHLAATAFLLSSSLLQHQPWREQEIEKLLRPCARDMCHLLERRGEACFEHVVAKISRSKVHYVIKKAQSAANAGSCWEQKAARSHHSTKSAAKAFPAKRKQVDAAAKQSQQGKENVPPQSYTSQHPTQLLPEVPKRKTPERLAKGPSMQLRQLKPRMKVRKHARKNSICSSPSVLHAPQPSTSRLSSLQAELWVLCVQARKNGDPPLTPAPGLAGATN